MDRLGSLRRMMLIRAFEAALMARPDHGFQLLSTGEEAVAVGLCSALLPDDQLLVSGRSIGAALARGIDPGEVMGELLGRISGSNGGHAGRGHIARPDQGFFGAHAVVGGNISIAAGVALAAQLGEDGWIAVCLFGDGACGAGVLHETLNLAALWRLPLLLVCNNNHLAISTPVERGIAVPRLTDLAEPFGIAQASVDGMDVEAVAETAARAAGHVRARGEPFFLECHSERLAPHSSATRETRPREEMATLWARCPIARLREAMLVSGELNQEGLGQLEAGITREIAAALAAADMAPFPDPDDLLRHVG